MFSMGGSQRQTQSSTDGRRDGAAFFSQSRRADAMCARDQQSLARASAHSVADGSSQWAGQIESPTLTTKRILQDRESTSRSECWIAVMPDTFFCPGMSREI